MRTLRDEHMKEAHSLRQHIEVLEARVAGLEAGSGDLFELEERLAMVTAQCEELAASQGQSHAQMTPTQVAQVRTHGGSTGIAHVSQKFNDPARRSCALLIFDLE